MSVAEWDDPEPLAEFDAKGQQPLYNVNDDDTNGLSRKLRIDALVSKIGSTNNGQREHMVETISEFSHDHRQGLSWLERRYEQQSCVNGGGKVDHMGGSIVGLRRWKTVPPACRRPAKRSRLTGQR